MRLTRSDLGRLAIAGAASKLALGPRMQKMLQRKFNKPGEKPLTTIITKPDDKNDDK